MTHHRSADIALVISDLGDGGAQRVLIQLAANWLSLGRRVTIVTQAGPEDDFFKVPDGALRLVAGGLGSSPTLIQRFFANLRRIMLLRSAIRKADAPVLVSFVGRTIVTSILACVGLQVRLIISERNDPTRQSLGRVWDVLRRLLYRHADLVTANTTGALTALSEFVTTDKLALVPNPVTANKAAPEVPRKPVFLSVGRLTHQKGYDVLVDAFSRTAGNLPDWRLQIVGRGELQAALQAQSVNQQVGSRVDWPGLVADPAPFYASAEVFVLSSRYEGMPNALLEAMSHGLAVIVTNASPGPLEYVTNEVSGLVVPADDPERLAEAMLRLACNQDLRHRLGKEAASRMEQLRPENVMQVWNRVVGFPVDGPTPLPDTDTAALRSAS